MSASQENEGKTTEQTNDRQRRLERARHAIHVVHSLAIAVQDLRRFGEFCEGEERNMTEYVAQMLDQVQELVLSESRKGLDALAREVG